MALFRKLLIANRGEIAVRIARTARRLGISTVAVYSDADANAWHVSACDEAQRLGAASPRESYLNAAAVVEAAQRSGAEAIHPGYGFLAENADFAEACEAAGVRFVGPSAAAIRLLGGKAAAKALARAHHLPVTPGYDGEDQDGALMRRQAADIGYPVLIKPTAGGGGRGMRRVERDADFAAALEAARREAAASFGDARVLIEKYISPARHVEVQVLGDRFGHCIHLLDRDCSVQRRHQKILEEAPAPALDGTRRAHMLQSAVALSLTAHYSSAGTVEFIVDGDGAFYFMEMNTRLQVEHPVTEMITGLDLVEWQLRIAAGEALSLSQQDVRAHGHAIEARVCAEDAEHEFLPATGVLKVWSLPPSSTHLRIDAGVREGDEVSSYYDSLLAKVIAWDETREGALERLRQGLAETHIAGVITNVAFLSRVLQSASFREQRLDTSLLEREAAWLADVPAAPREAWVLAALGAILTESPTSASPWGDTRAWRVNAAAVRPFVLRHRAEQRCIAVHYRASGYGIEVSERISAVRVVSHTPAGLRLELDGQGVSARLECVGSAVHVFVAGQHHEFELIDSLQQTFAAAATEHGLRAPMPGRVIAVPVKAGESVGRGAALLVIEAMKMEHTLLAPSAGRVEALHCQVGDQVAAGDELIEFAPEMPTSVAAEGTRA